MLHDKCGLITEHALQVHLIGAWYNKDGQKRFTKKEDYKQMATYVS